jgi:multicomponent Na+:H+ antiporter subunit D
MFGTLNMADLAQQVKAAPSAGPVTTVALLFLLAFGIKAAVFPLFFWLPASYHTPPVPVSSIFAALLTKVGVYALIRVFTLIFIKDTETTHGIILVVAGLTMVTGVLGAMAQNDFRRLLSFHIVSQIGYMIMGLGLFTPLALIGSLFHIIHNIFAKTTLFLVSGIAYRIKGTYDLKELGGLYRSFPGVAILFLIPAFALAGMPPLSGFWSKLILLKAGLVTKDYAIVAVALLVSLLTTYSMTKIWNEAFLKGETPGERAESEDTRPHGGSMSALTGLAPIVLLAALTVIMGLAAGPTIEVLQRAADQLMDPTGYINAVLGGPP